jgi:tetratricopeptide (TPR) repeat protein
VLSNEKAQKHFDRGIAAVESAKTTEDFEDAAKEFETAKSLARDWPDVYYNLGIVYDNIERYDDAIINLKYYLQLKPAAEDFDEVETMINKIEYKREKAVEKENKFNSVVGTWDRYDPETGETLDNFTFLMKDDELYVQTFGGTGQGMVTEPANFDGSNLSFSYIEKQSQFSSEITHTYTVKNQKLMAGSIRVNVISKQPSFPIQLGLKPAMPMELHKR